MNNLALACINDPKSLSSDIIGHLMPVTCGHTGHLNIDEVFYIEKHCRKAGFLTPSNRTAKSSFKAPVV